MGSAESLLQGKFEMAGNATFEQISVLFVKAP